MLGSCKPHYIFLLFGVFSIFKRKNALIRHKSIAEISQTLRQIEVPKVSKRATRNVSDGMD